MSIGALVGGLIGAGGSIVSGLLGSSDNKKNIRAQYDIHESNMRYLYHQLQTNNWNISRAFDQENRLFEKAKWDRRQQSRNIPYNEMMSKFRAADESGIHRLAALGAGAGGYQSAGGGGMSVPSAGGSPSGGGPIGSGSALGAGVAQAAAHLADGFAQLDEEREEHEKKKKVETALTRKANAEAKLTEAQSRTEIKRAEAAERSGPTRVKSPEAETVKFDFMGRPIVFTPTMRKKQEALELLSDAAKEVEGIRELNKQVADFDNDAWSQVIRKEGPKYEQAKSAWDAYKKRIYDDVNKADWKKLQTLFERGKKELIKRKYQDPLAW